MKEKEMVTSVFALGGMGEIGKNMTVFEYENDIIVVDVGSIFPREDMPGVDLVIPDTTYLEKNYDKLRGYVITHGHEDHIGAAPYIFKKLPAPVYGTRLTLALVDLKLKEHRISGIPMTVVRPRDEVKLGKFTATTCANATLYEMDDVIVPLVETIMDRLDADTETYGIFAQAVHECGYDSIASLVSKVSYTLTGTVVTNYTFTCMAVPNSVYQAAGINDVASLKSYLAAHSDNEADKDLGNYIKYHFLPRQYTKEELLAYESDDPEADAETRMCGRLPPSSCHR